MADWQLLILILAIWFGITVLLMSLWGIFRK